MLKENSRSIGIIAMLIDVFFLVLSFFIAYCLRAPLLRMFAEFFDTKKKLAQFIDYLPYLSIVIASCYYFLRTLGAYESMRWRGYFEVFKIVATAIILNIITFSTLSFILNLSVSRSLIILFHIIALGFLFVSRALAISFLRYWRKRGRNFRTMAICGLSTESARFAEGISKCPQLGIKIVKIFSDETEEDKIDFLKGNSVDEIVIFDTTFVSHVNLLNYAASTGIRISLCANLPGFKNYKVFEFGDIPLIQFQTSPFSREYSLLLKRAADFILASILLIVTGPLLGLIAVLALLFQGRPILYKQKRVGLNGRLFTMYKFRSMVPGADGLDLGHVNEMNGPLFKATKDPRITRFGIFIRKLSLDELPQLWNVFRGDMSLVGPRPPLPSEVALYRDDEKRRLSVKPGITGVWQTSGRSEICDFEQVVKLDLDYIDRWSLARDLKILIKTIPCVLFGRGAR